jgi:hypothetical protein
MSKLRKPVRTIPTPAAPTKPTAPTEINLLTPDEAASLLRLKPRVLERWRALGAGPAFIKFTSKTIRYRATDIEAFIASGGHAGGIFR